MNPWPVVIADLRAMRWVAWATPLLVAIAVAIGVAIAAQEASIRRASATAADDFDVLIGAPGSQTQLTLTAVYLQAEALPLLPTSLLNQIAADARAHGAAPLAFGDIVHGYPVIGSTRGFASRWSRLAPIEGRLFERRGEAVIGADVKLAPGDEVTPSHTVAGRRYAFGVESYEDQRHRHDHVRYRVVGRLPRLDSPWDRAILVPIESVWETHDLGGEHAHKQSAIGAPFDADAPGAPAIVVKPRTIADAYALRAAYRQGGTMAFFPAEVLVSLYRALGDARDILIIATALNNLLIFAAIAILLLALAGLRRKRYATLRALGASRGYILLSVWLGATLLLGLGCVMGLALGVGASWLAGAYIEAQTGLKLSLSIGARDLAFIAGLIGAGSLFALLPAISTFYSPVAQNLRDG